MGPIRIFPELKARIEKTYAGYATADPVATRGVIRVSKHLVLNGAPLMELTHPPE